MDAQATTIRQIAVKYCDPIRTSIPVGAFIMVMGFLMSAVGFSETYVNYVNTSNPGNMPHHVPDWPPVMMGVCVMAGYLLGQFYPGKRKNNAGQKYRCRDNIGETLDKMEKILEGRYAAMISGVAKPEARQEFLQAAALIGAEMKIIAPLVRMEKGIFPEDYIMIIGSRSAGAGQLLNVTLREALKEAG